MTKELDLVSVFEGLSQDEARELADRIRSAVLNEYQTFRQQKRTDPVKYREPLQPGNKQAIHNQRSQNGEMQR